MSLPIPSESIKRKWLQQKIKKAKSFLAKRRENLEHLRAKNPKVFDGFSRFAEICWVIGSTYCTNLASNIFVVALIMCFAFAGLYLFQWALLTNKSIREVEKEREIRGQALTEQKNEYEHKIERLYSQCNNTIVFSHTVAHNIKIHIARMPRQKISITRNSVLEFLTTALNSLEDVLSSYYGVQVRASIKLCTRPGVLKTYVRGQKNIESRGGISKTQKINKKEISISDNYAYKAIIERELQYFAEGDLHHLSDKENDEDKFFCEYRDQWDTIFLSSIIVPLRYPIITERITNYKMLGLICIDTKDPLAEWSNGKKSYAYQITAFFADATYNMIDQYMKRQEQSRTQNQKKKESALNPGA